MTKMIIRSLCLLAILSLAWACAGLDEAGQSPAPVQTAANEPTQPEDPAVEDEEEEASGTEKTGVVYQKHTVVDFGDDTIDGNLSRPDGQYLESRKRLRHRRLIKVRSNFRPQILQSVRVL